MAKNDPLILPYMAAFQCIGAECENTCCQGWKIAVDRETMADLEQWMGRSSNEKQHFDRGFEGNPRADSSGEDAAYLHRREDGFCYFFDAGLCSLQRDYGIRALGRTCSSFPRIAKRDGPHLIMSGDLGCPEVVRLLLRSDRSLSPLRLSAEKLPPKLIVSGGSGKDSLPQRVRSLILRTMDHLFQDDSHPFNSRMYMLAYLGYRLRPHLDRQTTADDIAAIVAECDDLLEPKIRAELVSQFEHLPLNGQDAFSVIYRNLWQRLNAPWVLPGFRHLCLGALKTYGRHGPPSPDGDLTSLFRLFSQYKDQLLHAAGENIDGYFEKAAFNLWFLERGRPISNLISYLPLLFFYLAEMKFLFFSHWKNQALTPERKPTHPEKIAVEVIHQYARSTFHRKRTEGAYRDLLRVEGLDRPPRLLELLKLL